LLGPGGKLWREWWWLRPSASLWIHQWEQVLVRLFAHLSHSSSLHCVCLCVQIHFSSVG